MDSGEHATVALAAAVLRVQFFAETSRMIYPPIAIIGRSFDSTKRFIGG
jgi:hypothetical protein